MSTTAKLAFAAGSVLSVAAQGQVFNWADPVSGNWTNAGLWNGPGGFPNGAAVDVFVLPTGPNYELNLDFNPTVGTFLLGSANATFRNVGRTFQVTNLAQFNFGRVSFVGGTLSGAGGAINRTQFDVIGTANIALATFENEGTIRVIADAGNNSNFSRVGPMTNRGAITLTSTAGNISSLSISGVGGTLVNAVGGSITSEVGAGGGRTLGTAALSNQGSIAIQANTAFNAASGTLTNEGAFSTSPGATFTMSGSGTLTFTQTAGTLVNNGGFDVIGETFVFGGGTMSGNRVRMFGGTIQVTGAGSAGFDVIGTTAFTGELFSGQRIDIIADPGNNSNLAGTAFNSAGEINLTSTAGNISSLTTTGNFVNLPGGSVGSQPGAGGGRFINTNQFINQGTLAINTPTTFNANGGTLENSGTLAIAPGGSLLLSGTNLLTFTQSGGTLSNQGAFELAGERFRVLGGSISGNDIVLRGGSLESSHDSGGGFDMIGNVGFSGTVGATQRVDIVADPGNNSTFSTLSAQNDGIINLTSTAGNISTLFANGTFTNSATGRINSLPGAGGGRVITTNLLTNLGSITIDLNTQFNQTNSILRNFGSFAVETGDTFTVSGSGSLRFEQEAGTLENRGTFRLLGETFEYAGGAISGNDIVLDSGALAISATGAAGFDIIGPVAFEGAIAQDQRVDVIADPGNNSTLTGTNFSNSGTLTLTSTAGNVSTVVANTLINTATGRIFSVTAGGGGRVLSIGSLLSDGEVSVTTNTLFNAANALFRSGGSTSTSAGRTLTLAGAGQQTLELSGGVLSNLGRVVLNGERLLITGGAHTGNDLEVFSGAIEVNNPNAAFAASATGTVSYAGNLGPNQRIDILADPGNNALLNAAAGFSNAGVINLTSSAGNQSALSVGGTLDNLGQINVVVGAGGSRRIDIATLANTGSVAIDATASFNQPAGLIINNGSFSIAAGRTFTMSGTGLQEFRAEGGTLSNQGAMTLSGERFTAAGGSTSGNDVVVLNGQINITSPFGTIGLDAIGSTSLTGNLGAGHRIDITADPGNNAVLIGGTFSSVGIINLTSTAGNTVTLAADSFTNSAGGAVNVLTAAGGSRTITIPDFQNFGTVRIQAANTWNAANAAALNSGLLEINASLSIAGTGTTRFINSALGTVAGNGTFNTAGIEVFANSGLFAPGTSGGDNVGTLAILGNWSQNSFGRLGIDIAGAGNNDLLAINGNATLDGLLSVVLRGGFTPAPSDSFVVLDATGSLTGSFSNALSQVTTFDGGTFDVIYDRVNARVILTNYIPAPGAFGMLAFAGLAAARRRR